MDMSARNLFLLALLGVAACSSSPPRYEATPCSPNRGDCTPEEIVALPEQQLRATGAEISVSCGVTTPEHKTATRALCIERVNSMLERLSITLPSFVAPKPANVSVDESETCLDTFIPGREAADCQFFSISARFPIGWRP